MQELAIPSELSSEPPSMLSWARGLAIATPDAFSEAGERLKSIKSAYKRIADWFKPMKQAQDEAKKRILDSEKALLEPLAEAERLAKAAMLNYTSAEQRKADDERRRLQAVADEVARREREALEKRAAAAKKPETIERLREEAAAVVAPVVAVASAATPKAAGVSVRKTWKAEIVDMVAFLKYACESVRTDLILPNYSVLEALAKGLKEAASMPGVKFFEQSTMSARG